MIGFHYLYSVRALGIAFAFSASSLVASTITYSIIDLPLIPYAINNKGQVVGGLSGRAVLWQSGSGIQDLGRLNAATHATAINDNGQVVGYSFINGPPVTSSRAFFWETGSGMQDLGGSYSSYAYGINDSGQVVGSSYTDRRGFGARAFLWQSGSGVHYLDTPPGTVSSAAYDINNRGQVVGGFSDLSGSRAYLWQSGSGMQDLDSLGGSPSPAAINDHGQVVGSFGTFAPESAEHAFLWQSESGMQDLGSLGTGNSNAYDINNRGEVVGRFYGLGFGYAFLYRGGQMLDLNTLVPANSGWVLRDAQAINDAGQIVGNGSYQGQGRAFLLTPAEAAVPEPATCALCGVALVRFALLRRWG